MDSGDVNVMLACDVIMEVIESMNKQIRTFDILL